ncbi:ATP-binding cassette domain-containing protein [Candidatus Izimaplasma bacterium]|nr:ATP-binding cassette domain-containing protein [Candidatus Izimaplasma bacterium]
MTDLLHNISIGDLITKYPFVKDFFKDHLVPYKGHERLSISKLLEVLDEEVIEDNAINKDLFQTGVIEYIELMKSYFVSEEVLDNKVTIYPGFHKDGTPEKFGKLVINKGEIISIVGPTGSGKSRLLADIEWAANMDTPTKRKVLINDRVLEPYERFSASNKLVAQLSQNMNFVMDLTVYEFLDLHATSRMVENKEDMIDKIFDKANELAGEGFDRDTPITELSGGQSRALMIADTAILSKSPIILIDEIENAGIDRKKALELLVSEEKIVLMSTHDPILALMGDKRIVIYNGGIDKVIDTTDEERSILHKLEELDKTMMTMRNKLRYGKQIKFEEES